MRGILSFLCFLTTLFIGCNNNTGPDNRINPNIKQIKWCCSDFNGGNFRMGVWYKQRIFCIYPGRTLDLSLGLEVIRDSLVLWPGGLFVSKNSDDTKLLIVKSFYSDVSVGSLLEVNTQNFEPSLLRDSTYNISSATFLNNDNQCIYYSYGNPNKGIQAGYYWLNIVLGQDSLVLRYISDLGAFAPGETVNGFDVSPDGRKMLIPLHHASQTPQIIEYDFSTSKMDTLKVDFNRQFLWLRYNSLGTQILYCNYPQGVGGSSVGDDTEIGVIDRNTLVKRILDVNTNQYGPSVSVFPNWSPDGKHIVYGSARGPLLEPPGAKGAYSLYVLKNVN